MEILREETPMEVSPDVKDGVNQYVWNVAAHLGNLPEAQRNEILQYVESHLYEALQARAGASPTVDDLHAVLAEMPEPKFYAVGDAEAGATDRLTRDTLPEQARQGAQKICWDAVISLGLIIVSLPLLLKAAVTLLAILFTPSSTASGISIGIQITGWTSLLLSIVLAVVATRYAAQALQMLRAANGELWGLVLAAFCRKFYPTLLEISLVNLLLYAILTPFLSTTLLERVIVFAVVDLLIIWVAVRGAKRMLMRMGFPGYG